MCSNVQTFLAYLLLTVTLLWSSLNVIAQPSEADISYMIERAFVSNPNPIQILTNCAYTQNTEVAGIGTMTERFVPNLAEDQPWQLIETNGEELSIEQLVQYVPLSRKRHPAIVDVTQIETESLNFVEETDEGMKFAFKRRDRESWFDAGSIENTVIINPFLGDLVEIRRRAKEPFRVQPWMKVEEYDHISTFQYNEETEGIVLESLELKIAVRSGRETLERILRVDFEEFDCDLTPDVLNQPRRNFSFPPSSDDFIFDVPR